MRIGEFEENEVRNMRSDALNAIDALKAIASECESGYVSRRYLREKIDKAMSCVKYVSHVVHGGEE